MSVDQLGVVDFVGVETATGKVVLTISDHLPWDDNSHPLILQEKLNCYLAFIESGEILESYPDSRGRSVAISIVALHEPTGDVAVEFLRRAREVIEGAGFELRWSAPRASDTRGIQDEGTSHP
jgi:hypothetical protein